MDWDSAAKGAGGLGAIGAAVYGAWRMLRNDSRDDKNTQAQDSAMQQVIATLREEVTRLAERLEKVEAENVRCREENAAMSMQIIELQKQIGAGK